MPSISPHFSTLAASICLAAAVSVAAPLPAFAHGEHDHDHDHAHDESHDHSHDHDHDHDHAHDHDHDHSHDHDHAGGSAHVHGLGELVVSQDGETLTISFRTALASVGISEREPATDAAREELETALSPFYDPAYAVALSGYGECNRTGLTVNADFGGGHGDLEFDYTFSCAAIDKVTGVGMPLFDRHETLETVNAVWVGATSQSAATLTAADQLVSP